MTTAIFHHGALGDLVLVWPIIRALDEPVLLIAPGAKAKLAARHLANVRPGDIESHVWSALHVPDADEPALREPSEALCGIERIISFVSDGRDAWAVHVRRAAPKAQVLYVRPRPPRHLRRHVCAFHREQLAGQSLSLNEPRIAPRAARDGPIVVHPGSGGAGKCWPAERFEQLIEALRDRGRIVLPVLGEVEVARWGDERVARWCDMLGARRLQTLDELDRVLSEASACIGNDAGPMHLAAQLGVPTLALFGPTDPHVWSPRGPAARVLAPARPCPMSWLDVPTVLALAERL